MQKLTSEESQRVHAAAKDAAARSHARFALMIVPASDRYRLYPAFWAAMIALALGGIAAAIWPALPFTTGFLGEAVLFVLLTVIFEWRPLRLALVPRRIKRHRARQMAHLGFAAEILAKKERPHGVLLFVSLGERYAEIIADAALHERVGEVEWQLIVDRFTAAAKAGKLADGFVSAIEACAAHLERHFPKSA